MRAYENNDRRTGVVESQRKYITNADVRRLQKAYTVIDIETTGLDYRKDRIVEICAKSYTDGECRSTYCTLVNAECPIQEKAEQVNHITADMIAGAPDEKAAIIGLMDFLADTRDGYTVCVYNSGFTMSFLQGAVARTGIDATFAYIDISAEVRGGMPGLENYKQRTVEAAYGINNCLPNRAEGDAESLGIIARNIFASMQEKITEIMPTDEELETCAYVQKIIADAGYDISWLRFHRMANGYVVCTCLYTFAEFRHGKNRKYFITGKNLRVQNETEPCSIQEGGIEKQRVIFNNPEELENIAEWICEKYVKMYDVMLDYTEPGEHRERRAQSKIENYYQIAQEEAEMLIERAKKREYKPQEKKSAEAITRNDVEINPVHNRVPLSQIKNGDNPHAGYEQGAKYHYEGDKLRIAGKIDEAIELFDKARYHGYCAPALYISYAKAYTKKKDYENVIVLMDEAIEREQCKQNEYVTRREKAIIALHKEQHIK